MGHQTVRSAYRSLSDRLNRFPQGAAPSALLYQILAMLFTEREAALVAQVPIKPFTVETAARIWKTSALRAQTTLDSLSRRAILVDLQEDGQTWYVLPPPMAGFFEFSLMRLREDLDQKLLSELFYQYMNVEEDFIKGLFTEGETQLGRTFVQEPVLSNEQAGHILDYERASEVIRSASAIGVGLCYCRHKMMHVGRACNASMDNCLTFNTTAGSLIRAGAARQIDVAEGLDLLQQAYDQGLVQFGENVRQRVNFICNCCSCCCEAMIAARRFGHLNPVHTTNYLVQVDQQRCNGCTLCLSTCPVEALAINPSEGSNPTQDWQVRIDEERCLGCGVCVRRCAKKALSMVEREARVLTPLNSTHRAVMMAIERGKLQELLFDNKALLSHRALAAIFGVILKLPPIKQVLATQQVKSRYLERLIERLNP